MFFQPHILTSQKGILLSIITYYVPDKKYTDFQHKQFLNYIEIVILESYAKKMRLDFSNFVTILLTIMLISIHMLKDETLRIPKW